MAEIDITTGTATPEGPQQAQEASQAAAPEFKPDAALGFARRIARAVRRHPYLCWAVVYCLIYFALIATTYRDYGVTIDETVQGLYGKLAFKYFSSGFTNTACNQYENLRFYGPLFEMLIYLAKPWNDMPFYDVRHFMTALTGLGTGLAMIAFGRVHGRFLLAVFASTILLLMPRFYGGAFVDSKDIPFACGVAWTMTLLTQFLMEDRKRWSTAVLLGLAAGLTLAVRAAGGPLILAMATPPLILLWSRRSIHLPQWRMVSMCAAIFGMAWGLMIAVWPFAYIDPLNNPLEAMFFAAKFDYPINVLYFGEPFSSLNLPGHYLLTMTLFTTPISALLLACAGGVCALQGMMAGGARRQSIALAAMLSWAATPQLLCLVLHPHIYDTIRHFLFMLPGIALLAGWGACSIVDLCAQNKRGVAVACLAAFCLWPVPTAIRIHPYQYAYFNELIGGLKGADGKFETDYWSQSYKEAAEWVDGQLSADPKRRRVLVAANQMSVYAVNYKLHRPVTVTDTLENPVPGALPDQYDFYIATTRQHFDKNYPDSPIVHVVGRDGVIFAVVRKREEK